MATRVRGVPHWLVTLQAAAADLGHSLEGAALTSVKLAPVAAKFARRLIREGKKLTTVRQYLSKARKHCSEKLQTPANVAAAFLPRSNASIQTALAKLAASPAARVRRAAAISPKFLRTAFDQAATANSPQATQHAYALSIAFFFLLRPSEYVVDGKHRLPPRRVTCYRKDHEGGFYEAPPSRHTAAVGLFLPHSKTDQAGNGESVFHQRSNDRNALCPVRLVTTALLNFEDGRALLPLVTYQSLLSFCKDVAKFGGMDTSTKLWSPQGCRRGGATAMFAAGADALAVKKLGRWSSDIFLKYNVPTVESSAGLSADMVKGLTLQ